MATRKNLPSTADAVAFINACSGEELVRKHYLTDASSSYIDFTLPPKAFHQPMGYALQRFWRVLGQQTHSIRPIQGTGYTVVYQWDFSTTRRLSLLYTTDMRTVVRLSDTESA